MSSYKARYAGKVIEVEASSSHGAALKAAKVFGVSALKVEVVSGNFLKPYEVWSPKSGLIDVREDGAFH